MDINFLKNIASNFEIEGEISSVDILTAGHINENYLIKTTADKKYVLRKINTDIFQNPDAICFNSMIVSAHIEENAEKFGIKNFSREVLNFVPTLTGEICFFENNDVWQTTVFIDNTLSIDVVSERSIAFSGGKIFGKFQKMLNGIEASFIAAPIENFHNLAFRIAQYYRALEEDKAERAQLILNEAEMIEAHSLISDRFDEIVFEGLPVRVTHNDTKISNVLFDAETKEAICVIDYDTIMPSNVLCDFGDMIRSYTNSAAEDEADLSKVRFRLDFFEAVARGYLGELKDELEMLEIMNLVFGAEMIIYEQAIRFLTDYLNGDVYYRTRYPEHNLVRARNQLTLLDSLVEQEMAAEEIVAQILES